MMKVTEGFTTATKFDLNLAVAYNYRSAAYAEPGKKAETIADPEKFITLTNNPQ